MKLNYKILLIVLAINIGCKSKTNNINKHIDTIDRSNSINDTIGNKFSGDADTFQALRERNLANEVIDKLRDSIKILNTNYDKRVYYFNKYKDSIKADHIIIKEKLGVAEFKLLRIREYNRIAAKGNNIKFLRSWINRVINK